MSIDQTIKSRWHAAADQILILNNLELPRISFLEISLSHFSNSTLLNISLNFRLLYGALYTVSQSHQLIPSISNRFPPWVLPHSFILRLKWLRTDCIFGMYSLFPYSHEQWKTVYQLVFFPPSSSTCCQFINISTESVSHVFQAAIIKWIRIK